ncbi:hypothetical protein BXZ70DRAFT_291877 [Cristinia sonorae]|uniref:Uncharacterized protein n=1 Tax=Cristinia sonorae TaxID=1940300 RepID=A0A8K0UNB9_9AGAR|nr:hypothetical protein BXZ70DRAFT_291877 [Cristinia sonorae]
MRQAHWNSLQMFTFGSSSWQETVGRSRLFDFLKGSAVFMASITMAFSWFLMSTASVIVHHVHGLMPFLPRASTSPPLPLPSIRTRRRRSPRATSPSPNTNASASRIVTNELVADAANDDGLLRSPQLSTAQPDWQNDPSELELSPLEQDRNPPRVTSYDLLSRPRCSTRRECGCLHFCTCSLAEPKIVKGFLKSSDDSLRKRKSGPARTDPYQAPYFFPTPASAEAADYANRVRQRRRKGSCQSDRRRTSGDASDREQPRSRRSSIRVTLHRCPTSSSQASSAESWDCDGAESTHSSPDKRSQYVAERPQGFKRLFSKSPSPSRGQSFTSGSDGQPLLSLEPGKEKRKGPWSLLRRRRRTSTSVQSETSLDSATEKLLRSS